MNNLQRVQMELKGIDIPQDELKVYLLEHGISDPFQEYNAQSNKDTRSIYQTALSVLEQIANQPQLLKNYKQNDISVSAFAENLQARIDQLSRKIRMMSTDDSNTESSFFMLFSD